MRYIHFTFTSTVSLIMQLCITKLFDQAQLCSKGMRITEMQVYQIDSTTLSQCLEKYPIGVNFSGSLIKLFEDF